MRVPIPLVLLMATSAGATEWTAPLEPTDDGNAVRRIVYARPFTLETPHVYQWSQEKPEITSGHLLVLDVDPEFARPRQVDMPVLYVGPRPAELTNHGDQSGMLVVIVAGDIEVASAPIFYGSYQLPERVDAARGQREVELARQIGIEPFGEEAFRQALIAGESVLALQSAGDLYVAVADLITQYSPDESERAESYRMMGSTE